MNTQRKTAPGKSPHERGSVLVVAIIVIVAMLIISIPFLFRLSAQSRTTEKGYRSEAAFHLAEAGVEKTLWRINEPFTDPGNTDTEAIQWTTDGTNQLGTINDLKTPDNKVIGDIAIIQGPPSGTEPALMTLTSTGRVPFIADALVNRTVRVNLERYYESVFNLGFFVDDFFYIHNAFSLDSYNSADGAYGATLADGTLNAEGSTIFGTNGYAGMTRAERPRRGQLADRRRRRQQQPDLRDDRSRRRCGRRRGPDHPQRGRAWRMSSTSPRTMFSSTTPSPAGRS